MSPPWRKLFLHIPHQRIVILLVGAGLITACGGNGLPNMTPDHLLHSIENQTAPIIVDVRTEGEYESGHVPGAVHLPFYAMWNRHEEMKAKPDNSIVLYCEHGPRAWIGKFALWTVGYIKCRLPGRPHVGLEGGGTSNGEEFI